MEALRADVAALSELVHMTKVDNADAALGLKTSAALAVVQRGLDALEQLSAGGMITREHLNT